MPVHVWVEPMIKSELVQRISEHNPHLYQRDVENIVNAILDEIVAALARGDRVELRGFGAFSVKHRPARAGRSCKPFEASSRSRNASGTAAICGRINRK